MIKLILSIVIQRITAALSILGSSTITYAILSDRKRKLNRPYHRLMLMMSFLDILQSSAMLVSTAAFPRDSNIYGAKGNESTCYAQGFFIMFGGLAVPLYNACLHIYYALIIKYRMSPERFTKFEPVLHAISILVPLFIASFNAAIHDGVAPKATVCFPRTKSSALTAGAIITLCFIICIASMACICWKVISQAKTMKKYTFTMTTNTSAPRSRVDEEKQHTIKQAFLYSSAFILTYSVPFIYSMVTGGRFEEPPFAVTLLTSIFYPLQGFWNACFYIRPGLKYVMDTNPNKSRLGAIIDVIFRPESTVKRPMQSPTSRRNTIPFTTRNKNIANNCTTSSSFQTKDQHSEEKSSITELDDTTRGSDKLEAGTQKPAFTGSQACYQQDGIYRSNSIDTALDAKKEGLVERFNEISDDSQEVYNEVRSNDDTKNQEPKKLIRIFDSAYIANSLPRIEGSTIYEDLEHQSEVKFTPQVRRSSLVVIGSILSGLDDEFLDIYSISD